MLARLNRVIFIASVFAVIALLAALFGGFNEHDRFVLLALAVAPSVVYTLVASAQQLR